MCQYIHILQLHYTAYQLIFPLSHNIWQVLRVPAIVYFMLSLNPLSKDGNEHLLMMEKHVAMNECSMVIPYTHSQFPLPTS